MKNNKKTSHNKEKIYFIIPITIIAFLIPLIVYMKALPLHGNLQRFWTNEVTHYDFFSYYKMFWFLIFSVVNVILFLYSISKKDIKIKRTNIYIFMSIYAFFVLASTLLSKYTDIALFGFVDRYEGFFVIISYIIVMFIAINIFNTEKQIKIVIYALVFSSVIIGTIGIFQYFGYDFFKTNLEKSLMLPPSLQSLKKGLDFKFGAHTIYSTLYHYDYVGSYVAMLFPISLVLFLMEKKRNNKILLGIYCVLMFINLAGCNSRAGIVGGVFAVLMLILVMRKHLIRYWKAGTLIIAAAICIAVVFNIASKGRLTNKIFSLYTHAGITTSGMQINNISIDKNNMTISSENNTLILNFDKNQLFFKDGENNSISTRFDQNKIYLNDSRYSNYDFSIESMNSNTVIQMNLNGATLYAALTSEGFKMINYKGELEDLKPIASWGFKGQETLGSARGYIWSRSIPLLKNTLIVGYGPDTFSTYFPQNDYLGKLRAYNTSWILVDKPHDMYLQTAINTGVISLLALLGMLFFYFIQSFKIYSNIEYDSFMKKAGLGIFTGLCGYAVTGIFNDSVISVAVVFWILLGVGISINYNILKTKDEK